MAAVAEQGQTNERESGDTEKPPGAPKRWVDCHCQRSTHGVPHTIAVCGDDRKRVVAGWQIPVICNPLRTGLYPILIESHKLVSKFDLLGIDKAQAGVANFKIFLPRSNLNCPFERNLSLSHFDIFNDNRRRLLINRDRFGINDGHSVLRGKPEPAISRLPTGWLAPAVAFNIEHSIFLSVGCRSDASKPSGSEVFQFLTADTVDAQIAAHPEIAV